jgi:hypothetical protein
LHDVGGVVADTLASHAWPREQVESHSRLRAPNKRRRMTRLWSWTGLVLAALYAFVFVAFYLVYLSRAGTWFADLPLALAALPFTLTMRALCGGFDFAGDMPGRVLAGAVFCSALAYAAGLVVETAVRAAIGAVRTRGR